MAGITQQMSPLSFRLCLVIIGLGTYLLGIPTTWEGIAFYALSVYMLGVASNGSSSTVITGNSGGDSMDMRVSAGSSVTMNGRTLTCGCHYRCVNGVLSIDGVVQPGGEKYSVCNITVTGSAHDVKTAVGDISIGTTAASVSTTSGDVDIGTSVGGGVTTVSGDVEIGGDVAGSIRTVSGDVKGNRRR
jgi:hypothetical protein